MSTYWVTDSLSRTRKDGAVGSTRAITLHLGRRETRSCQLNIKATSTNSRVVRVTADEGLTVALFKEHYFNLTTGSAQSSGYPNHGEGPGWWPDGLTPLNDGQSVLCTVNVNQSVWVDITAPADIAAGTKTVTIAWSGTTFTITVVVGDFSLPERPVMGSLFRYLAAANRGSDGNNLLRTHRLLPMYTTVADSRNQNYVSCSFNSKILRPGCTAEKPVLTDPDTGLTWSAGVAAKKARLAPVPTDTTLYSYSFDEPGTCADSAALQATAAAYYAALNANTVKMLITMAPHSAWNYANMIPVVLPKLYVKADVDAWVAAGRIIWSYNCLNQDGSTTATKGSPKWLLDMKPLNYRIFGMLNQVLGFSGMLYWACDDWSSAPWTNVELPKWGTVYPGEGMLVYPATGTPDGDFAGTVLPSMRLKQLRDASQDYDLVWLCEQKGLTAEAAAAIASVGTGYTWGSWSTNKDVIIAAQVALEVLLSPPPTPPTAAFSANIRSGTAPLTVQFSDASVLATSWAWDFGDTETSTSQNPSHQYAAAGTYTVTLVATNAAGSDPETKAGYIVVSVAVDPPVADFTWTPHNGVVPLTVTFTDTSTNPTSWLWDFGDGTSSTDQNPVHEYTVGDNYTVALTATNVTDSDTKTVMDAVAVAATPAAAAPVASFSFAQPAEGLVPISVTYTDTSTGDPVTWAWDFGDGQASDEQNPTHSYNLRGTRTLTVRLVVTNAGSAMSAAQSRVTIRGRYKDRVKRFRRRSWE